MNTFMERLLIAVSGSARFQRILERNVSLSQFLMGIGAGTSTDTSGEKAMFKPLLEKNYKSQPLCIFDVGANKGQFLKLATDYLHDLSFQIHSFEPGRETFRILTENAKEYANVILNNFGLGRQSGEFNLFYDEAGSGLASLTKRRLDHFDRDFSISEKVKIETLDDYCANHNIHHIDLLKLDVEGHELDVLQGSKQALKDGKIGMISFEFGGCNIDSRTYFQDFFYFFRDNRMGRIFRITPAGTLISVSQYKEIYEQFRTTNFLAMPDAN